MILLLLALIGTAIFVSVVLSVAGSSGALCIAVGIVMCRVLAAKDRGR
jgi:hypothetical protein